MSRAILVAETADGEQQPMLNVFHTGPLRALTCMLGWPVVAVAYRWSPWLMARRPWRA